MTSQETTRRWVVINKENGSYWAGGTDWAPDTDAAYVYTSKQAAKDAYRDVHGKFPQTLDAVTLTDEQCHSIDDLAAAEQADDEDAAPLTAQGGVTDETPGQTDRVAAALASASAKVAAAEEEEVPTSVHLPAAIEERIRVAKENVAVNGDAIWERMCAGRGPLSEAAARDITDRIIRNADHLWQTITEAYIRRAHVSLGYETWDAYCDGELSTVRLKLPREERQEVVQSLRDAGMTYREIGSAMGINHQTAANDLSKNRQPIPDQKVSLTVVRDEPIADGAEVVDAEPVCDPKPEPVAAPTKPATPKVDKLTAEVDTVIAETEALAAKVQAIADLLEDRKLKVADGTWYSLDQRLNAAQREISESFDSLILAVDECAVDE